MPATLTILFGAGGHAKVVLEALRASAGGLAVVVLDDAALPADFRLLDLPVAGGRGWLTSERTRGAVVIPAIGSNRPRAAVMTWVRSLGATLGTVRHPSSIVSPSAVVGAGSFLAPGAIVNAQSRLGEGVIVNTGASIDHDCELGDAVHVGPGARLCGGVRIGTGSLVGVGALVIPGITIGEGVTVGAGGVVVRDVANGQTVVGNPARAHR